MRARRILLLAAGITACGGRSVEHSEALTSVVCVTGCAGNASHDDGGSAVRDDGGRAVALAAGGATSVVGGQPGATETTPRGGAGGAAGDGDAGADGVPIAGAAHGGVVSRGGSDALGEGGGASATAGDADGGHTDVGAGGDGTFECHGPGSRFIDEVIDYGFGGGQNFNQDVFPTPIFGPPEANDPSSVVSLGNGGFVVVGFSGNAIVDGPGVDFTVFENPLPDFHELATVAVSDDGVNWFEYPCTAPQNATDFGYCAGVGVVYSSSENDISPLDPTVSGGDHYDLADLGITRARYVRITDRPDLTGPDGVFDLDAVAIVNAACP